jgi:hypothetical protein
LPPAATADLNPELFARLEILAVRFLLKRDKMSASPGQLNPDTYFGGQTP